MAKVETISISSSLSAPKLEDHEDDSIKQPQIFPDNCASSSPNAAEESPNCPAKKTQARAPKPDAPAILAFPMARVRRVIKSEEEIRTNLESAFLVNKATEWFLEQFLKDSYEYVPEESKTILGYKQLSLVVANQKRYEFLADFVPQKIRAADALSEKASAEN